MLNNLKQINQKLSNKSPKIIIDWALSLSKDKIVTTSFGRFSSVLLYALSKQDKNIDVVWCDSGYNTNSTYEHALSLTTKLNLNVSIYTPLKSKSYLDYTYGSPSIDDPTFEEFTQIIKIEPFTRALKKHNPKVWFTNIREGQTKYRSSKGILSFSKDGILKVSPFYHWTDDQLEDYIINNELPINEDYYDITKITSHRECGIHFQ